MRAGLCGRDRRRDQVLVEATGPNPAPSLAAFRRDLNTAGLSGLNVRVGLVPASYQPLPG